MVSRCFTKSVWQMSETETRLKNQEIKTGIYRVICVAVKSHGHAFGKCHRAAPYREFARYDGTLREKLIVVVTDVVI